MNIPITKPFFDEAEANAVAEVLKSGWIVQGPKVKEFEEKFARFTGAKHAVATTSCTTALHISLAALGIGEGDEVIVPAFTFVATANACEYQKAKPVFVDVDPRTFNIDPAKIEAAITAKTKAIIPVHLFGLSADMEPILAVAKKHNLKVVEDAACGFGSFYKDKHVGVFGDTGCFSLHPRKAITCGEGGVVTTDSDELAELARSLRDHGASMSDLARHKQGLPMLPEYNRLGYNYRMTDLQGAVICEQMKKAEKILVERKRRAGIYGQALKDSAKFIIPFVPEGLTHSYQSFVLTMKEGVSRDEIADKMVKEGIGIRQGTHSVPHLGYYRQKYGYTDNDFPLSLAAERKSMTIPLFATMTDEEQAFVVDKLING